MNKRLYLYCTLLLCIMSCMMLYTLYDAGKALVNGYAEGTHMTDLELKAQQDSVYAKSQEYKAIKRKQLEDEDWATATPVSFKVGLQAPPTTFINQKTGKPERVWMRTIDVNYKSPHYFLAVKGLSFLIMAGLSLTILILAFKLIARFRNSENIFLVRNLKLIRRLAFCTLIYYVLWWTITLVEVYFIKQSFSLEGCNIDLISTLELPNGLFEVPFTFIVYEVFSIGVKMREENQLTV